jgi:hypothetical protein
MKHRRKQRMDESDIRKTAQLMLDEFGTEAQGKLSNGPTKPCWKEIRKANRFAAKSLLQFPSRGSRA